MKHHNKLAFLGPSGTFSEEAAQHFAAPGNFELLPCDNFYDTVEAVKNGEALKAVLPVENSVEGTISTTLDLLVASNLIIEAEFNLSIVNNLLALPNVSSAEITDIISHPQPLAQCQQFIRKNWPNAKTHVAESTADAADYVSKHNKRNFAAVGNINATKHYGLELIASNINDYAENVTRFVLIGDEPSNPTGHDKTSIVFTLAKDRPGGLYKVLGEFARDSINLTKIESRPAKKGMGDYLFFIDMEGHQEDALVAQALKAVMEQASFYKNMGSYPRAR